MFKKMWGDSVWSKVISTGIIVVIGFLVMFIYGKITSVPFTQVFDNLIHIKIDFWMVIAIVLVVILLVFLFKRERKPKVDKRELENNRKIDAFKKRNREYKFNDDVLCRFKVEISGITDLPYVYAYEFYCTLHFPPKKFYHAGCPEFLCKNHYKDIDEFRTLNDIESHILADWYNIRFD